MRATVGYANYMYEQQQTMSPQQASQPARQATPMSASVAQMAADEVGGLQPAAQATRRPSAAPRAIRTDQERLLDLATSSKLPSRYRAMALAAAAHD